MHPSLTTTTTTSTFVTCTLLDPDQPTSTEWVTDWLIIINYYCYYYYHLGTLNHSPCLVLIRWLINSTNVHTHTHNVLLYLEVSHVLSYLVLVLIIFSFYNYTYINHSLYIRAHSLCWKDSCHTRPKINKNNFELCAHWVQKEGSVISTFRSHRSLFWARESVK
jgi:hypothetical protein